VEHDGPVPEGRGDGLPVEDVARDDFEAGEVPEGARRAGLQVEYPDRCRGHSLRPDESGGEIRPEESLPAGDQDPLVREVHPALSRNGR